MANIKLHHFPACFTKKYVPEPNSGCWLWLYSTNIKGYGNAGFQGKSIHAHRLSWILHKGEIPDGLYVLHRCDTPCCVNPDHLFLGTNDDNMRDMVRKGRAMKRPGILAPSAKLTDEDIPRIRADTRRGPDIAKAYGVTRSTINKIKRGELWAHVASPPEATVGHPCGTDPNIKRHT